MTMSTNMNQGSATPHDTLSDTLRQQVHPEVSAIGDPRAEAQVLSQLLAQTDSNIEAFINKRVSQHPRLSGIKGLTPYAATFLVQNKSSNLPIFVLHNEEMLNGMDQPVKAEMLIPMPGAPFPITIPPTWAPFRLDVMHSRDTLRSSQHLVSALSRGRLVMVNPYSFATLLSDPAIQREMDRATRMASGNPVAHRIVMQESKERQDEFHRKAETPVQREARLKQEVLAELRKEFSPTAGQGQSHAATQAQASTGISYAEMTPTQRIAAADPAALALVAKVASFDLAQPQSLSEGCELVLDYVSAKDGAIAQEVLVYLQNNLPAVIRQEPRISGLFANHT